MRSGGRTNKSTDGDEDVLAAVPLIESQEAHSRGTRFSIGRQGIWLAYILIYLAAAAVHLRIT